MALTVQRDLDRLVAGLGSWLGARKGRAVEVQHVERPTDGWSSETVLLGTSAGGFAFRLAPLGDGIFPTYDLHLQARALTAAARAGTPVPAPVEVVDDVRWVGDPFLVMPLVEGHVPGELVGFDPWVTGLPPERRPALHEAVLDVLVGLHRFDPSEVDLPRRDLNAELSWWRGYLDWSGAEVAVLDDALAWCLAHRPHREPTPALLWGDVRLGNVVFADDGSVAALLDWEMASLGAPEHDLGWWWGLEGLQDELVGGRPAGFGPLDGLRTRYEAALGRSLMDLEWYETFALLRSAAVLTRIGRLQQEAGVPPRMPVAENPVLDHLAGRLG